MIKYRILLFLFLFFNFLMAGSSLAQLKITEKKIRSGPYQNEGFTDFQARLPYFDDSMPFGKTVNDSLREKFYGAYDNGIETAETPLAPGDPKPEKVSIHYEITLNNPKLCSFAIIEDWKPAPPVEGNTIRIYTYCLDNAGSRFLSMDDFFGGSGKKKALKLFARKLKELGLEATMDQPDFKGKAGWQGFGFSERAMFCHYAHYESGTKLFYKSVGLSLDELRPLMSDNGKKLCGW